MSFSSNYAGICDHELSGQISPLPATLLDVVKETLSELVSSGPYVREIDPYSKASSHFSHLASIFAKVETLASETEHHVVDRVLGDRSIKEMLPKAHTLRALFEYELEWREAVTTIESPFASEMIVQQVQSKIEALPRELLHLLESRQRVMFVGSGPLPTTALALNAIFGRKVVCIDRDPRANDLARAYVERSGIEFDVEFVTCDLTECSFYNEFDTVLCAYLIGVEISSNPLGSKSKFVRQVANALPRETLFVLRCAHRLGGLIYPLLYREDFDGFEIKEFPGYSVPNVPYDKTFTTIQRTT